MRGLQALSLVSFTLLATISSAQQPGHIKDNYRIPMPIKLCSSKGNCQTYSSTSVTLDAGWRWIHNQDGSQSCFSDGWSQQLCPDGLTCAQKCYLEGVPADDMDNVYGVSQVPGGVRLQYVMPSGVVGSRNYLLDGQNYYIFKLLNKEISVTIDASTLPCGTDASFYFSEMEADGGKQDGGSNTAGAPFGTGYCDAQCPKHVKFINGEANSRDWNNGQGHFGACCAELDIIEANAYSSALTLHPCNKPGLFRCEGQDCDTNGAVCEKVGCDINPYRVGAYNFYGKGNQYLINTLKPYTIVTQFKTHDGTDNGELVEIRRVWIQDGKTYSSPHSSWPEISQFDSHSDDFCDKQRSLFKSDDKFRDVGGMKSMGEAMRRGMVLVMSLWDDWAYHMTWLDSKMPEDADPNFPGVKRGECPTDSGDPNQIRKDFANSFVKYYDVKIGPIGSTFEETNKVFLPQ